MYRQLLSYSVQPKTERDALITEALIPKSFCSLYEVPILWF